MKKLMRTFALLTVAALGLSACNDDKLVPDNGNADGKFVTVHFGAEAAIEGATKATLTTEDELKFNSAWENGDVLSVKYSFDYGEAKETTATWSAEKSCFEAQMDGGKGDWTYDALYPAPNAEKKVDFGSARTQNGSAYNSKYDLMKGSAAAEGADAGMTKDGKKIVFEMTRQTAIAYFHLTSTLNEEVVSAKLSVEGATAYLSTSEVKANEDYAKGYAFTKTEGVASKEINLTFDAGPSPKTSDFKLWFNVLPTDYDKMTLTVETANHTLTISRNATGKYEAGKLYKVVKNIPAEKWVNKGGETPEPSVIEDVLTADKFKATETKYEVFTGVKATSPAVYAGNSAKSENGHIQIRSKNSNSGIVTTASGGKVKTITIVWSADNTQDRTIDVYGKNTPYTSAANLYATNNADQGTKLGSLNWTKKETKLTISGEYAYVGVRSNSGALMIESISITWETGSSEPAPDTYTVSCATVTGGTLSASPIKAEAGAEITLTATPAEGYAFNNDWSVKGADESVIEVVDGKFTMPAQNVTVSGTFVEAAAVLVEYVSTFTDQDLSTKEKTMTWTSSLKANSFESANSSRGVQFGAEKGKFTITGTGHASKVKKISVIISTNKTGNTISATVGGVAIGKPISLKKDNNYEIVFESTTELSGDIVFNVNNTARSVYIKSITVNPAN